MELQQTNQDLVWNMTQEPRCHSYQPASYMLLLSALDKGWQITKTELTPSWDQTGFVYLVTLRHSTSSNSQELVLPRNPLTKSLLSEIGVESTVAYPLSQPYRWYG